MFKSTLDLDYEVVKLPADNNFNTAISGRQLKRTGMMAHPNPLEINTRVLGVLTRPLLYDLL